MNALTMRRPRKGAFWCCEVLWPDLQKMRPDCRQISAQLPLSHTAREYTLQL